MRKEGEVIGWAMRYFAWVIGIVSEKWCKVFWSGVILTREGFQSIEITLGPSIANFPTAMPANL
ncbi:MAG: hypothetical protein ACOVLE_08445 [Pirellula staleyi]